MTFDSKANSSLQYGVPPYLTRKETNSARAHWLYSFYKHPPLRPVVMYLILRLEGGVMFSDTLREVLINYHGVKIGAYSYGPCFYPVALPRGTILGNYCSLAGGISVFRRNHPVKRLSLHPLFYNHYCGLVEKDSIELDESNPLVVEHDVWIGCNSIILPNCKHIGIGSVIGAGSVVTKDVPAFTIVAGNPARIIRERFSKDLQKEIMTSQWWDRSISDLARHSSAFLNDASFDTVQRLRDDSAQPYISP